MPTSDSSPARSIHLGGIAAIAGALLAIAGNVLVSLAEPSVPSDVVSYPLSSTEFQLGQVFFAATQALMALGIAALARTGIARIGRAARVFAYLAVLGFVLTVPGELVLALVADAASDSADASAASSVFGIGVLIADIGLIGLGVVALRAGWRPRAWVAVPLALGVFQLVVVTPVVLATGFASFAAFAVIAIQDVLVATLGVGLVRGRYPRS